MKRRTVKCPYCGAGASLRPAETVYGASASPGEYLYVCDRYPRCDAYVSAHRKNKRPMRTLANGDLRHKRIQAHQAFQAMQRASGMSRPAAYRWLRAKLGLTEEQAHIAGFGEYLCDEVIRMCREVCDAWQRPA